MERVRNKRSSAESVTTSLSSISNMSFAAALHWTSTIAAGSGQSKHIRLGMSDVVERGNNEHWSESLSNARTGIVIFFSSLPRSPSSISKVYAAHDITRAEEIIVTASSITSGSEDEREKGGASAVTQEISTSGAIAE
jgi:hypothetical protein